MLKSLTLTNWKSFGKERNVVPFAPLTLVVGPNASGKSNALDALRFLQGVGFDYTLAEVLTGRHEGRREIWPGIRGFAAEASRVGMQQFTIQSEWAFDDELAHSLRATSVEAQLLHESLSQGADRLFETTNIPPHLTVRFETTEGETDHFFPGAKSCLPFVARLGDEAESKAAKVAAGSLIEKLRNIAFLDIQPHQMRDYHPAQDTQLSGAGENISSVLAALDRTQRQDISDWVEELWTHALSLSFDRTQLQEVMLYVTDQAGHRVSARSLSDGTLRFLGLVTALLTAPPGSLVVIEEPDMGMHPARIHLLVQLLEMVTTKRGIQVIATTHSPTLLAHLGAEALGNVVAMSRSNDDGTTACSRLSELPHFDTLKGSEDLAHLVSLGWIERAM